jgi:hypothetical protein
MMKCKVCKCTDDRACEPADPFGEACAWVAPELCSACVAKLFGFRHEDVLAQLTNLEKLPKQKPARGARR